MQTSLVAELERMMVGDPRGRPEEEWLDVLEFGLMRLKDLTGSPIEVGEYWIDVGAGSASASLGARIRADGPLLSTASDCWEAAFCVTGGADGAYADVMAFPFLRGSVVNRAGRLEELSDNECVDEFWLHYVEGGWEERGWRYPDGAGEWDYIRRPGDAFFRSLRCSTSKAAFVVSEPLLMTLDAQNGNEPWVGDDAWISIHRLRRDQQRILDAPCLRPLPRPRSAHRAPFESPSLPGTFHPDILAIPGGWAPGHYRFEVRLHHARSPTSRDSYISDAVEFEVLES